MKYLYHYLFLTTSLILLGNCTKDTLPGTDTTTPPSLETDTGAEAFEGWTGSNSNPATMKSPPL